MLANLVLYTVAVAVIIQDNVRHVLPLLLWSMVPVNVLMENMQHFLVRVILARLVNFMMVSLVNSVIQTACFAQTTMEIAKNVDQAMI